MSYRVSICIPIYRVEAYIERCTRSVLEQTYDNIEFIFVNDCTPDKSIEKLKNVISEYPSKKNRINIISHDINKGLAAARNTGVECASGEFIMHVDSDDWIEPDAVELLVKRQLETGADIVSGNAIAHYDGYTTTLIEPDYKDKEQMLHNVIKLTLDHVIWRRLIRRDLYIKNNIYAQEGVNIGEDHHTLPKLVYSAGSIAKIDIPIYHYNCQNSSSYTRSTNLKKELTIIHDDLASIDILSDFFYGKGPTLVKELKKIRLERLLSAQNTYVRYSRRDLFKENWNRIHELKNYWNQSVLSNPLKLLINKSYLLKISLYNGRHFLKSLLQPIRRKRINA